VTVVVDANLLVALALNDPRAPLVEDRLRAWRSADESLHAPALLRYEAANALTRVVAAGQLAAESAPVIWERIVAVAVTLHSLDDGAAVIAVAAQLGRQSAYDAAYIALAQSLDAELWTLDGPLARNASGAGFPVRLLEPD